MAHNISPMPMLSTTSAAQAVLMGEERAYLNRAKQPSNEHVTIGARKELTAAEKIQGVLDVLNESHVLNGRLNASTNNSVEISKSLEGNQQKLSQWSFPRFPNKKRYYVNGKMTLTDAGVNDLVQYLNALEANEKAAPQETSAISVESSEQVVAIDEAVAEQELQIAIAAQDKAMPVSYMHGGIAAGIGDVVWKVSNPSNDFLLAGVYYLFSFVKHVSEATVFAAGEIISTVAIGGLALAVIAPFTREYKFHRAEQVLLERRKVQIAAVKPELVHSSNATDGARGEISTFNEERKSQIEAIHELYDEKLMSARSAAVDSGKAILGIWLSFKIATEVLSPAMPYLSAFCAVHSLGAYYGVMAVVAAVTVANYGLHMTRKFWCDEYHDRNKKTFTSNLKPEIDEELKAKGLLVVEGGTENQLEIDVEKFLDDGSKTELLKKNKKLFKAELKRQQRVLDGEDKNLIDAERRQDIAMVRSDCLDRHRAKGLVYMESIVEGKPRSDNLAEDSSAYDRVKSYLKTSSEYVFRTQEKRIRQSMLDSTDERYKGLKDKHDNEFVPERAKSMAVVFGTIVCLVIPFAPQILQGAALGKWALLIAGAGITAGFAMVTTSACSFFGNRMVSHSKERALAKVSNPILRP